MRRRILPFLPLLAGLTAIVVSCGEAPRVEPRLVLVAQVLDPVLTIRSPGAESIRYGFEGGRVVKVGRTYHLFTSEMVDDPVWVKMRLGHWESSDGITWSRVSTLFESSGNFDGTDPRASLWSPMPVFDPLADRWELFYVAYHSEPNTSTQFLSNQKGRVWRAVSETPGQEGVGGPYRDVGVVLEPGPDSGSWEGLQGTDSFFPYQVGPEWYAFYGSARTEVLPIEYWWVGLARAPALSGPWTRCSSFNPVRIEEVFIENPIVTQVPSGHYLCVYDNRGSDSIGYSFSTDGLDWRPGFSLVIQPESGQWSGDVRTPLGLVPEADRNVFTLFYTGFERPPDWEGFMKGEPNSPCAVGKATLRLVWENVSPRTDVEEPGSDP